MCSISSILQWHQLDRTEQAKYYDQARRERALHMQLYPGWSARENYAQQGRKKKRKRDKSQGDSSGNDCETQNYTTLIPAYVAIYIYAVFVFLSYLRSILFSTFGIKLCFIWGEGTKLISGNMFYYLGFLFCSSMFS